jgi:uncharacterized protein (TIGR02996 family)
MDEEAALWAAIHAEPDDEVAWLVLGDWLEDHANLLRAELFRLTLDLRLGRVEARRPALEERQRHLLASGVLPPVPEMVNSVGMRLALIPPGTFWMGSRDDEAERGVDEGPVHEVAITRPFYLGQFPVTVGQFRAFVGDTGYQTQNEHDEGAFRWDGSNWTRDRHRNWRNPGFSQAEDHPVTCITWDDAQAFLEWLSHLPQERTAGRLYRLPTEAEWEYACRAGASTPFHFGASLTSTQANFNGRYPYGGEAEGPCLGRTVAVGSYPRNAFGLAGMHGNVWEWCSDWYDKDYYARGPRQDPPGPSEGLNRVCRGGGWYYPASGCRSADRDWGATAHGYDCLGFRVAVAPSGG